MLQLRQAATQTAVEYFQKTSLNGFGLLYHIRRRRYQRLFWFAFIALGVCCAAYVVFYTLSTFLAEPTVTTLEEPSANVWDTPFPAVAVCSNNKLSRHSVEAYAAERARSSADMSAAAWRRALRALSGYFDFTSALNTTQARWLDSAAATTSLLWQLAPTCDQLLLRCEWAGQPLADCDEIFAPLATRLGHCCAFNNRVESTRHPPNDWAGGSRPSGLTLQLNASAIDYWLTVGGRGAGFTLLLFDSQNYPDRDAGCVQELSITAGSSVDVELFVSTQLDEASDSDGDAANCMVKCKARALMALCGCTPYNMPIELTTAANATAAAGQRCSLMQHVECVATLDASDGKDACRSRCLSPCAHRRYNYHKQTAPARSNDQSRVNLYFPSALVTRTHRKNVLYSWYQILSNIGGVLGICMGCSFISGCEIVYFVAVRLPQQFLKLNKEKP